MPLQGNLAEMSLANLIQVNCQEMRSAQLTLQHADQSGEVYFSDGQVVHAVLGTLRGESALFKLLKWGNGTFVLNLDTPTPEKTITASWNMLLLEGMKRVAGQSPKPSTLAQLRAIEGVTGAVIASSDGIVLEADIPGGDGENEAATAVFIGSTTAQLAQALQLGAFGHGLITLKNTRLLILQQPDRYISLILSDNGSPTIVANAASILLNK